MAASSWHNSKSRSIIVSRPAAAALCAVTRTSKALTGANPSTYTLLQPIILNKSSKRVSAPPATSRPRPVLMQLPSEASLASTVGELQYNPTI